MESYKGWIIEPFNYQGYSHTNKLKFQAWNTTDNEMPMLVDETVEGIKIQIDDIDN